MALPQTAGDGQIWLITGVGSIAFFLGLKALAAYWVYRDASARGSSNPRSWGIWVAVVDLVVLSYLYNRWRKLGERQYPRTSRDRVVETGLIAGYGAFVVGAMATPPDPITTPLYTFGLLVVTLPVSYVLVYRDGYARLRAQL